MIDEKNAPSPFDEREYETLVPLNRNNKTKLVHNVHVAVRVMPLLNQLISLEKKIWRVKSDQELEF